MLEPSDTPGPESGENAPGNETPAAEAVELAGGSEKGAHSIPRFKNRLEPLQVGGKGLRGTASRKRAKRNGRRAKRGETRNPLYERPEQGEKSDGPLPPPPTGRQPVRFEVSWRNLVYYPPRARSLLACCGQRAGREGRPILSDISGSFRSGQMTALMGPSGAGKTVCLNCLCGLLPLEAGKANSGDILVHGVQSARIGFVEQFDHLLPRLTVHETLVFASRIKNASRFYLNHEKVVANVMAGLDLTPLRHAYAAHCSNGQRKRLSIAIELVFNSDILMLDEPTTGLDSATGFQIMSTLKAFTKRSASIAVVATIHQPSLRTLHLFDTLIVLARDGSIIYQGSPADLPHTLRLAGLSCPLYSSLADYILEVASGDFGPQSVALLRRLNLDSNRARLSDDCVELELTGLREAVKRGDRMDQRSALLCFWLLFWRNLLCNWRNPFNTQIRVVSMLATALLLGLIFTDAAGGVSSCPPSKLYFWQVNLSSLMAELEGAEYHVRENVGLLFMLVLVSLFNSMLNLVVTFPQDVFVFRREYNNYTYSVLAFLLAKLAADAPFVMSTTAMFAVTVHRMTGQFLDHWSRVWLMLIPCWQVGYVGQLIGMAAGVLFYQSPVAAVYSVSIVIIPFLLCSGFFKMILDLSWLVQVTSYFSVMRPALNALLVATYGLDRCQLEERDLADQLAPLNQSGQLTRPEWVQSLSALIDLQSPELAPLEQEAKLVRYMGYGQVQGETRAIVLQHFGLAAHAEAYWAQIRQLAYYMAIASLLLYLTMRVRLTRTRNQ